MSSIASTRQLAPTTKGRYDKRRHSYEILGSVNPSQVTKVSPYANRLIEALSS